MILFFQSINGTKIQVLSKFQSKLGNNTAIISKTIENNRKNIEQQKNMYFFTFFSRLYFLVDKWYQNTSPVRISAQTWKQYGYYKQNNREQQEEYRTIEKYAFFTFFPILFFQSRNGTKIQVLSKFHPKLGNNTAIISNYCRTVSFGTSELRFFSRNLQFRPYCVSQKRCECLNYG